MRRYVFSPLRITAGIAIALIASLLLGALGAYQYLRPALRDVTAIKDIRLQVPLRVYSRDGKLIARGAATLPFTGAVRRPSTSFPSPPRTARMEAE